MISNRSWYKPFSTVLFCPPTPDSLLDAGLRRIVDEETKGKDWSVRVIERAGVNYEHQLPGLKEPSSWTKTNCLIHRSGGKGDCKREGLHITLPKCSERPRSNNDILPCSLQTWATLSEHFTDSRTSFRESYNTSQDLLLGEKENVVLTCEWEKLQRKQYTM